MWRQPEPQKMCAKSMSYLQVYDNTGMVGMNIYFESATCEAGVRNRKRLFFTGMQGQNVAISLHPDLVEWNQCGKILPPQCRH